ncbi:MAG: M1 family metallopeptidase [Bacteroidetes bacterium]|nr:M1 family metallopeptidase [Bacteroidota bacterium]
MKKWIAVLLVISISIVRGSGRGDKNIMAGQIDVLSYTISITIMDNSDSINATTVIAFDTIKDLDTLKLNFKGMNISKCSLDNQKIFFQRSDGLLKIVPESLLVKNSTHQVSIKYSGLPQDGLFIGKNKYGKFCAFADNWPNRASYWFPCIDHPSDKAKVTFHIAVPKKYEVIANGDETEFAPSDQTATYSFSMSVPITTYCMVFGVCDFSISKTQTSSGVPVYYYTFPEDSLTAAKSFQNVPDIIKYFESVIGPYPYSKLALVESSTKYGGMENSSAIFLPERSPSFTGRRNNDETVAHEIAHQWFGDDVSISNWSDLWLSEGFATYCSALYFESRDGEERFNQLLERIKEAYSRGHQDDATVVTDSYSNLEELLNVENYDKGALFLNALRKFIGDEFFFKGIKEYYKEFKHSNVSTDDFKKVMSSVSKKNLDPLFHKWLYEPGSQSLSN